MATERKAHVAFHDPAADGEHPSLAELNRLLNDGWLPIHATAMGGAGAGSVAEGGEMSFAALVILERQRDHSVSGFSG